MPMSISDSADAPDAPCNGNASAEPSRQPANGRSNASGFPYAYQPPRVTPIGTLPESTGMQVSNFQLGDEPAR